MEFDFDRSLLIFSRHAARGPGREWIDAAADRLRAACAYAAPQRLGQRMSPLAHIGKSMLEEAGIRPGSDVRECNLGIDDLVDLWETLAGDTDALEAARGYLVNWPPTVEALASLAVDMALPPSTSEGERQYALLSGVMASNEAIVRALGDAARAGQRARARAEAQRFSGTCADAETQYLILRTGPNVGDTAVLVSIPRGDAARSAGVAIGLMNRADAELGLYEMPSPAPDTLPPRVRPYAAFIPALLATALADDNNDTSDEEGVPSWDPGYWRHSPLGVVRSLMKPVVSPIAVSPQFVLTHLKDGPESLQGARYAWLDECVLERLLNVGAGQHAASVALQVPSVYDQRGAYGDSQSDLPTTRDAKRRGVQSTSQVFFQPPLLGVRALDAIVRSGSRVALESLPAEVADPLAYGIWRAECASAAVDENSRFVSPPTSDRLIDVSRYWGMNPTDEQVRHPQLLCGAMARGAVVRDMIGSARLLQQRVARVGPPLLTTAERGAINSACAAPRDMRFVREPNLDTLFDATLATDPWIGERLNEGDPLVGAVVGRVRHLIAQANEVHNVERDESPRALPLEAQGIPASVQVLAAIAALRSGLDVNVDDLADAGSVCALLASLDALFP
ncbi:hypothetical protein pmac_cds_313 [Pandoravirus macleodensis]|uniref:Uncharacterized protein n=1 Tax=Pandoravirus macleodensis TaxID=2107707 RepID=A0A2U7UEV5_9VIRU|nr:hypothetical protein pmac_cds_313 [Pandoravirus macleodensis]AVK77001.1 hypothetical protein pmac_cds_313 [Pandoravirus macleodensis]